MERQMGSEVSRGRWARVLRVKSTDFDWLRGREDGVGLCECWVER